MAGSLCGKAGSLGGSTGTLCERVADVLHGKTVDGRTATLHERAAALRALRERAALYVRAELGNLC